MTINAYNGGIVAMCNSCGTTTDVYMPEDAEQLYVDIKNIRWKINTIDNTKFRCPQCDGKPISKTSLRMQTRQIASLPYGYLID